MAAPVSEPSDEPRSGAGLTTVGVVLLVVGALVFASATRYGGGGTAGIAIVLFVAGLVTFFAGRVRVAER